MRVDALRAALAADRRAGVLPMAIVANAGTTNTGAIDPLQEIGKIALDAGIWFHVDGAYGLPGVLDERVAPLYAGLELADSVIVDPHKWLGAAVGVAAPAIEHSMDDLGVPYYDFGVELSAPSRGVVVWALLREIGVAGMTERIRRHNDMARHIAQAAAAHPKLELLLEPTLSICCFRYVSAVVGDLDALNQRLHRRLTRENRNMPSTTRVNGKLALRPCFIGARSIFEHAEALVADVLRIGAELEREAVPCMAEEPA